MGAYFLSADLLFGSRVAAVAKEIGQAVTTVASPTVLLERYAAAPAGLVIVDISLPGLDIADLVARLYALPQPPATIVAYAPHVHEELLAAAAAAGCTQVLSRGQFSGQIERVLREHGNHPL